VSVNAQSGNLLTNPGFEPPFTSVAGAPPREVAQGWTPWHVAATPDMSSSENIQPEYYPASDVTNGLGEPRIRSGSDAQQYFSFFATHVGGVYQTVSGVTPGAALRFSVYAYLWSSTFDEADESADDGGMVLQVGIDPTGGTDGESTDIIWSIAGQNYDTYTEYTVSAAAAAASVTVFVRSSVSFPVKNNVVYLDDAALMLDTGDVPTATTEAPTAVPVTTEAPTAVPATDEPTAVPTNVPLTDVPPSATLVPPTTAATATPITATVVPPTDVPPTATLIPPTATLIPSTATLIPSTATPIPSTATPIPSTATPIPASPTTASTPLPSPTLDRTQFPLQIIYQVATGDTVGMIAARYGTTIQAIIIANGLNENALIFAGQQLIIPVNTIPTITNTPTATATGATATNTPAPTATLFTGPVIIYVLQPGDTVSTIAQRFGTTVRAIAQANNILNLQLVFAGQRLIIPSRGVVQPPRPTATRTATARPASTATLRPAPTATVRPVTGGIVYRVQSGDNLYGIAVRFGVTVNALVQVNQIANPSRIFVGQLITIP